MTGASRAEGDCGKVFAADSAKTFPQWAPTGMSDHERNYGGATAEQAAGPSEERHLWNTRGLFPDDTPVAVRYPAGRDDREIWLAGTIVGRFGPDEWEVAVDDPRVAPGWEEPPLVRCGAERMRVLTDREWSDLVDDAYRAIRRRAWLGRPFPASDRPAGLSGPAAVPDEDFPSPPPC